MSGKFVSLVLDGLQDVEVHPTGKLVAAALADCANMKHGGIAFPSVTTLARKVSISEAQVRSHLRTLEGRGWIVRQSPGNGGKGQATRYGLNLPKLHAAATAKATVHRRVRGNGPPSGKRLLKGDGPPLPAATVHRCEPDGPPSQTQRSTVAELEVTGITSTGSGTSHAREASVSNLPTKDQNRLRKAEDQNPTSNPLAEQVTQPPEETDTDRNARIEEKRRWSIKQVDAARRKS